MIYELMALGMSIISYASQLQLSFVKVNPCALIVLSLHPKIWEFSKYNLWLHTFYHTIHCETYNSCLKSSLKSKRPLMTFIGTFNVTRIIFENMVDLQRSVRAVKLALDDVPVAADLMDMAGKIPLMANVFLLLHHQPLCEHAHPTLPIALKWGRVARVIAQSTSGLTFFMS